MVMMDMMAIAWYVVTRVMMDAMASTMVITRAVMEMIAATLANTRVLMDLMAIAE